jgi:hypothetical protein
LTGDIAGIGGARPTIGFMPCDQVLAGQVQASRLRRVRLQAGSPTMFIDVLATPAAQRRETATISSTAQ